MNPNTESVVAIHETIEARLRLADQRYTSGRRRLVDCLIDADHPMSIEGISQAIPSMPRSTAYRNLVDLRVAGVVRRVTANDDFVRFELTEDLTEHHHHLICLLCGCVLDVDSDPSVESLIGEMAATIAAQHGFITRDHRLDILGRCRQCASRDE